MNHWTVAGRLNALKAVAVLVMALIVGLSWYQSSVLHRVQAEAHKRLLEAGELQDGSNLGAQAYRVVADTFINRHFDEAATEWAKSNKSIAAFLVKLDQTVDTAQEREWARAARASDSADAAALRPEILATGQEQCAGGRYPRCR
jgi:hypothetical protein